MKKAMWFLIVLAVAGIVAVTLLDRPKPTPPVPAVAEAPAPLPPPEPEIRYPLEPSPAVAALPPLGESDPAVREALGRVWGERALGQLFNLDGFVRRVVATIDNLPREKAAVRLMPVKPASGPLRTAQKDGARVIDPANAERYTRYVQLATAVDSARLVELYAHFYPLFQQAYEDLGYPKAYFNDRLVEVIDHLLATPELPQDAVLVQPKVLYRFADPDLEARSAGQKIMLRMGDANATRVKAKLREVRAELTRRVPQQ